MTEIDAWVAERQAELDALLRDHPNLYMAARRKFQQEYEAKLETVTRERLAAFFASKSMNSEGLT